MAPNILDKRISEQSANTSHAFPALSDAALDASSDPQGSRNHFKPLFQCPAAGESFAPQEGFGVSQIESEQDLEDQIRQKGFEHGFDTGKQDACRMARQELTPEIKAFTAELNQLNENLVCVEENSCRQIIKMALSISEKILSAELDLRAEELDCLKGELKKHMQTFHQLKLIINPRDLEILHELLGCEIPNWQNCTYVQMDGDIRVQQGDLMTQLGAEPLSSDGTIIQSLEKTLEKVSTK